MSPRVFQGACCGLALSGALGLACDQGAEEPPKSRVQAVLVEPGSTKVEPAREPARSGSGAAAGSSGGRAGSAAPAAPRPVLCDGQLETKASPFKPRVVPTRVSLDETVELAKDPLDHPEGRWTWINFWAAWCVPCKQELPLLFGWQKKLAGKVEFRFISLDDDERQLRDFLGREPPSGLTRSYWLPDGGVRQAWLQALKLDSEPELPLQLLIDPKGALRCRVQGAVEAEDLAALERIVRG
jgi:thiol-disulfide isomerase/thioredoxin